MRCITAEEREALFDAALPTPGHNDAPLYHELPSRMESATRRMIALGNAVLVTVAGEEFADITPRGRLALACYAAVHSVLV